jgi:hypothetical protein
LTPSFSNNVGFFHLAFFVAPRRKTPPRPYAKLRSNAASSGARDRFSSPAFPRLG